MEDNTFLETLKDPIFCFIKSGMYKSASIFSHYLYKMKPDDLVASYLHILCLYEQKYYEKINLIIQKKPELKFYACIKLLLYKSGLENEPSDVNIELQHTVMTPPNLNFNISYKSLEFFYLATQNKEQIRKQYFLKSFEEDYNNTECLLHLHEEGLITYSETKMLIKNVKNVVFRQILDHKYTNGFSDLETPLDMFIYVQNKYNLELQNLAEKTAYRIQPKENDCADMQKLFRKAIFQENIFGNNNLVFFILGICYMYKKEYREATKTFTKSVQENKNFGLGYLYLGISNCLLRETDCAIKNLSIAYSICSSSCLPSYYLGYEYWQMNNYRKSRYFYEQNIKMTNLFSSHYIYFLIYNEDYESANVYIQSTGKHDLLEVFCLLFVGNYKQATEKLQQIQTLSRQELYYATKGYLCHLINDFDGAINEYLKSLNVKYLKVVDELYNMAVSNKIGQNSNLAFNYANCLFETLEYKERILLVFD